MGIETDARPAKTAARTLAPFADCDVHNAMPGPAALMRYLPQRWHAYHETQKGPTHLASSVNTGRGGGRVTGGLYQSRPQRGTFRWDTTPPTGGLPGTDFDFMKKDYLETWPVREAILAPLDGNSWPQYGEYAAALAGALNDWNNEEWLLRDKRYYGTIIIPTEDGELGAAEIKRSAVHRRFVQVLMPARTRDPLGHRKYWPIYRAAAEAGLPVALHVGGAGNPVTGTGWASYHFEYHAGYYHSFQAQVITLIASGVFDAIPDLKLVMEEGGFLWAASLIWRMDRAWELMGPDATNTKRRPSELLREHFWFTTQPMDDAESPPLFQKAMKHMDDLGLVDRIMFATDYPHWDFDSPVEAVPAIITGEWRDKIFGANARALYRFDSPGA